MNFQGYMPSPGTSLPYFPASSKRTGALCIASSSKTALVLGTYSTEARPMSATPNSSTEPPPSASARRRSCPGIVSEELRTRGVDSSSKSRSSKDAIAADAIFPLVGNCTTTQTKCTHAPEGADWWGI